MWKIFEFLKLYAKGSNLQTNIYIYLFMFFFGFICGGMVGHCTKKEKNPPKHLLPSRYIDQHGLIKEQ